MYIVAISQSVVFNRAFCHDWLKYKPDKNLLNKTQYCLPTCNMFYESDRLRLQKPTSFKLVPCSNAFLRNYEMLQSACVRSCVHVSYTHQCGNFPYVAFTASGGPPHVYTNISELGGRGQTLPPVCDRNLTRAMNIWTWGAGSPPKWTAEFRLFGSVIEWSSFHQALVNEH